MGAVEEIVKHGAEAEKRAEMARQILIDELNRLADIVGADDVIAIDNAISASEEMAHKGTQTPEQPAETERKS